MYQVCAVGHILLYSCKVTQFPEIPREFSFFLISLTFSIWNTPR